MRLSPEKIPAPDHRSVDQIIAVSIAQQKNEGRGQIEKLRREYQSLASDVHEIDPRHKLASFPAGDPAEIEVPALKAMVASAKELVVDLRNLIPQLLEQKETERKAGLSPIEALDERVKNLERGAVDDRAEIAALRAQFAARFGSETSSPSLRRKQSEAPPLVPANAQRGGGAVNKFFGDDEAVPPSGGVRRVGRPVT